MMCCLCWREFKGWCRAFTRTETLLAILEGILLVICIGFIVFLILHFIVCGTKQLPDVPQNSTFVTGDPSSSVIPVYGPTTPSGGHTTLNSSVKCTWEPSKKTAASTRYYEQDERATTKARGGSSSGAAVVPVRDIDDLAAQDPAEAREDHAYAETALALVRVEPPEGYTFGCFLTPISVYWTLTAASCIEAIEETDAVESFVMMEHWSGRGSRGRAHDVAEVRVWPRWAPRSSPTDPAAGGRPADPAPRSRPHDLAALRSSRPLQAIPVRLPSLLDYYALTIGERLDLLGFGAYRSESPGPVRAVAAWWLPLAECAGWAARHVSRAGPLAGAPGARCGALGAGCAGPRRRAGPCRYCAGSPLLRGRTLLALVADAPGCGVSCDPSLVVNIAAALPWIAQLDNDD